MGQKAIKLELIEWLKKLNDIDTLNYLKAVKDSSFGNKNWWNDLAEEQRLGIQRGIQDIDENRIVSHTEVNKKYGL